MLKKPLLKQARAAQAGFVNILLVSLAGIGVMALTASNLNSIRSSQDQQFALHTNTLSSSNAWDGVELFRVYLGGLSSTDLAALQSGSVAVAGISNISASIVSNVVNGTGRRITANIIGSGANSTSTVQVIYNVASAASAVAGSSVTAKGDVDINGNLKLSGNVTITNKSSSQIWVNGTVDITGTVTGAEKICSSGNVKIDGNNNLTKVCTNGTLTLLGSTSVVTAEAVGAVAINGNNTVGTINSNGAVSMTDGTAGTINTKGNVSITGGNAKVTSSISTEGNVIWTSSTAANTINANGNVAYSGINNNTVINSRGNVTLTGNGNVKDINALGNVALKSSYANGVQGTLLGAGTLTYISQIKAFSGKVTGMISGPIVNSWDPVMNVTRNVGLSVTVPTVSVPTLNFAATPIATVDVYALKSQANYIFEVDATGKRKVTVKSVAGITDGSYFLGDYGYDYSVPSLARGNKDYLCTAVNASGICTAPTLPYKTLCQGQSEYNGCFTYNAGTKKWSVDGQTMAPGFAFFEGGLNVGNGTYFNSFAASGHITTSGLTVVYAPNYRGYGAICSNTNTTNAAGIARDYRLTGLVPTDVCNTSTSTYTPNAIGNIALVAGGFVGSTFQGGNITLGDSNKIYGGVIAGNLLNTGGDTTINGAIKSAAQGSAGATQTTTWTSSTTMDLTKTTTYDPSVQPCMINCASSGGGGGGSSVFWSRYL